MTAYNQYTLVKKYHWISEKTIGMNSVQYLFDSNSFFNISIILSRVQ